MSAAGRSCPDLPGLDMVPYFTNSSLLDTDALPEHLIVVGGSYIGLEFAQIYRRLGSRVTVDREGETADIARGSRKYQTLSGRSWKPKASPFACEAECIRFQRHAQGVEVGVDCAHGGPDVIGSHVLLAVGRRPNTDDLGIEKAGIAVDARGYIRVDDRLETTIPGIWALGDCNGRGAFTHTSYNDYEIVADNLLEGADRKVTDRIPCYALYVDPPLGRVGMTETEARAAGRRIAVGSRPMTRVGRAREKDETLGLMKIVVDADTNAILGGAILGTGGDEAIHCIVDMMAGGGDATTLAHTMHIHPTVSELIPTMAGERKASP